MDSNHSLQVLSIDELQLASGGQMASTYTIAGDFWGHTARQAWNGIRSGYEYVEIRFLDWVME
jgi:hypothetical protein